MKTKKILVVGLLFILTGCKKNQSDALLGNIVIREEKQIKGLETDMLVENNEPNSLNMIQIYFTNTEKILQPDFLPTYVIQELKEKTQDFLISKGYMATELEVIQDSEEHVSSTATFMAKIKGYENAIIKISYNFVSEELTFSLVSAK